MHWAHLRNSPLSLLMIGDNYLKQPAYRCFWKQLVQLIKTASFDFEEDMQETGKARAS